MKLVCYVLAFLQAGKVVTDRQTTLGASASAGPTYVLAWPRPACNNKRFFLFQAEAVRQALMLTQAQEGDGISPTAIREIMLLRELRNPHIVRLDSVHICREVRLCWSSLVVVLLLRPFMQWKRL